MTAEMGGRETTSTGNSRTGRGPGRPSNHDRREVISHDPHNLEWLGGLIELGLGEVGIGQTGKMEYPYFRLSKSSPAFLNEMERRFGGSVFHRSSGQSVWQLVEREAVQELARQVLPFAPSMAETLRLMSSWEPCDSCDQDERIIYTHPADLGARRQVRRTSHKVDSQIYDDLVKRPDLLAGALVRGRLKITQRVSLRLEEYSTNEALLIAVLQCLNSFRTGKPIGSVRLSHPGSADGTQPEYRLTLSLAQSSPVRDLLRDKVRPSLRIPGLPLSQDIDKYLVHPKH